MKRLLSLTMLAIVVVALIGFVLGVLLIRRMIGSNPATNSDYDRVVQLIQEGKFKLPDNDSQVLLPSEYAYLSLDGKIMVLTSFDTAHTRFIFFLTSTITPYAMEIKGYTYKQDDVPPFTAEFLYRPGAPSADGSHCDRVKPQWFFCTYGHY